MIVVTFFSFVGYCILFSFLLFAILCIPICLILALKERKMIYIKKATIVLIVNIIIGVILMIIGPFNKNESDDSFYQIINVLECIAVCLYVWFGSTLWWVPRSKMK